MGEKIQLNSPITINNKVTVKNRFFKSAMSEQLGDKNHAPNHRLVTLYRTWAQGGTGLSMTGNVMVDSRALGEPKNVVLEDDRHMEAFRAWAKAGTQNDTHLWMQLNHPGKQSPNFLTKEPLAPSAIPLGKGLDKMFNTPRAATEAEIREIIRQFATSAGLAKEAGFSGVQIHGAHGYLVSQFLSPRHNQRTDQWGGNPENRLRFLLEIYRAMRNEVGERFPIGIKLNSADFLRGGFTEEESMNVVRKISEEGVDLIEVSGGTYEAAAMMGDKQKESTRKREAYFLEYAEQVKKRVDVQLVVTGGFRSRAAMLDALSTGAADMIGVARPLALVPDFPNQAISNPDFRHPEKSLTTGFKPVDRMAMLGITWYEHQLAYMSRGKKPNLNLSPWISVGKTVAGFGKHAFTKRRAG